MRRVSRSFAALAFVLAFGLVASACGGGGSSPPSTSTKTQPTQPASTIPATTATTPIPPGMSYYAEATVPSLQVFDAPAGATPARAFENPWYVNNDKRFPVTSVYLVEQIQGDWVKILLPIRPNGSVGWVRAGDVALRMNPYRITVNLSTHKLQVFNADKPVLEDTVAVGAKATPTPTGTYYIRVLLQAPDPTTVYGPFAYGLSSHSETLDTFNGGDAEIGIHGNNDASVLGQDVSHGCIRMDNAKITQLTKLLPLGTPVEITK